MSFVDFRRRIALKFGKLEHKFGRLIAVPIILGLILNWYLSVHRTLNIYNHDYVNFFLFAATFVCWFIYLASHTIEKKCYGNYGFR